MVAGAPARVQAELSWPSTDGHRFRRRRLQPPPDLVARATEAEAGIAIRGASGNPQRQGGIVTLFREERKAKAAAGREMCAAGLAVGTWGQQSAAAPPRESWLAITPSGMESPQHCP